MQKLKNLTKIFSIVLTAMLLFAVIPAAPAAAQTEPETPKEAAEYPQLEEIYQKLLEAVDQQHEALENAKTQLEEVQLRIEEQQTEGHDTVILDKALEELKGNLLNAHRHHELGEQILKNHPGFDDKGNVTNPFVAKESLTIAMEYLKDAREIFVAAVEESKKAIVEYQITLPKNEEQLEQGYQLTQTTIETIQDKIESFEGILEKAEAKLIELEESDIDVTGYQENLEVLQADLLDVQSEKQAIDNLLYDHVGFDENGKVTDLNAANETMQSISNLFENIKTNFSSIRDRWLENQAQFNSEMSED